MPQEIERKFLLRNDDWRQHVAAVQVIRDALILTEGGGKLRIRICDGLASLTLKGPRLGLTRQEYEYPLPMAEAEEMIATLARGRILAKRRHLVPQGGLIWEIDQYDAPLQDVILADVELPSENHPLPLPDWVGPEVTGDPRWRKLALLARVEALAHASVTKVSSD